MKLDYVWEDFSLEQKFWSFTLNETSCLAYGLGDDWYLVTDVAAIYVVRSDHWALDSRKMWPRLPEKGETVRNGTGPVVDLGERWFRWIALPKVPLALTEFVTIAGDGRVLVLPDKRFVIVDRTYLELAQPGPGSCSYSESEQLIHVQQDGITRALIKAMYLLRDGKQVPPAQEVFPLLP